jgi:hypothetical protein
MGDDATALLICDNLDAHVAAKTMAICTEGKATFMYALPPTVTEAIQPIDAGFGRSVRCAIGRKLDEWLLTEENLEKWERGMTAGERRILISNIAGAAFKETMKDDKMRVGCFKRTGCLLTLDGTDDELIRPQGCTKLPLEIPQALVDLTYDPNAIEEVVTPEEWDGRITPDDAEINFGDDVIAEKDEGVTVNESVDDNEEDGEGTSDAPAPEDSQKSDDEDDDDNDSDVNEDDGFALEDREEEELLQSTRSGRRVKARSRYIEAAY